jgi:hypothetical protein
MDKMYVLVQLFIMWGQASVIIARDKLHNFVPRGIQTPHSLLVINTKTNVLC